MINRAHLDVKDDPNWNYRKPNGTVTIEGRISKDLSLFFTEEDVRTLFNWKRPMYQNICKLMSQQYAGFSSIQYPEPVDLSMQIQSVLTELKVFNFLTEDQSARKLLYEVCHETVIPNYAMLGLH